MRAAPIYTPLTLEQLIAQEQQVVTTTTKQEEEEGDGQQEGGGAVSAAAPPALELQDALCGRLRIAYGYSLSAHGQLQLLRGLPPFPDWVRAHYSMFRCWCVCVWSMHVLFGRDIRWGVAWAE